MTYVKPARARHMADYFGNQLRIVIPSKKRWFELVFLIFWLTGWTVGDLTVLQQLLRDGVRTHPLRLLWLTGWTVGGLLLFGVAGWLFVGQELILIDGPELVHRPQLLGLGPTRRYSLAGIENLRVCGDEPGRSWRDLSARMIAFDYGAQTVRLGSGIDAAAGGQIVTIIQQYARQQAVG